MPIFKRKVKDRGQHLCRQVDRDLFNPVERLANGEAVQNIADTLPDQTFHLGQIARRHHTLSGGALHVVNRWVHGNKLSNRQVITVVTNGDRGL